MTWKLGWVLRRRRLKLERALAYIKEINQKGEKVYSGIRATEASEKAILESIQRHGELTLCLIPTVYFSSITCGNDKRIEKVRQLFRDKKNNLSKIPPIVIGDYKHNILVLLDGAARATVAYEQQIPLLGYIPEKLIPLLKGVTRI